jgi:hypothetical protein
MEGIQDPGRLSASTPEHNQASSRSYMNMATIYVLCAAAHSGSTNVMQSFTDRHACVCDRSLTGMPMCVPLAAGTVATLSA